jgi:hypothetical protein
MQRLLTCFQPKPPAFRRNEMMKFLALYLAPTKVIEDWTKTDPDQRKAAEEKMQEDWNKWMGDHASMITDTRAGGKTKRVVADGISDVKNDIMLFSLVEAESHEAAAQIFKNHPHLRIPQSSVEIMEIRSLTGH